MNLNSILNQDNVILHEHSQCQNDIIDKMINQHFECGNIQNVEEIKKLIQEKDTISSIDIENKIIIFHIQDISILKTSVVALVSEEGIRFNTEDKRNTHLFFMIVSPDTEGYEILELLSQTLINKKKVNQLIKCQTQQQFIHVLNDYRFNTQTKYYDIVAITACSSGLVNTYIAEKSLEDTATKMGIKIKVETHGASGIKNELTKMEIQQAKCIIIAADKEIDLERFDNKAIIKVNIAKVIQETEDLLKKAIYEENSIYRKQEKESLREDKKSFIEKLRDFLDTSLSCIVPILMISGILQPLIPLLQINYYAGDPLYSILSYAIYMIEVSKGICIGIYNGLIAKNIGGKSAFVIGFLSSYIVYLYKNSVVSSLIIGLITGVVMLLFRKLFSYLPVELNKIKEDILIPVFGICLIFCFIYLLFPTYGQPILVQSEYVSYILPPIYLIILGMLIGIMMTIDKTGIINKLIITIGVFGILMEKYSLMSAIMIAGMVPSLVVGMTMLIMPQAFSREEIKDKWRFIIKGLCFDGEQTLMYISQKRMTLHLPCIVASSIAGALSMYYGCQQMFPSGGIWAIGLIQNFQYFLIALCSSTLIGVGMVITLKKTSK